ncbi:MAG: sulfurtransferase TusA family protein [Desulfitobacterium hafniense]|nr:sulfurtransferase TusA family protein [Desulfitobacterium hafniense]
MEEIIDVRGLLCPEPVLVTKQAIDKLPKGIVKVLVDNNAAKENVIRLAENLKWNVTVVSQGFDYLITLQKN